MPEITYREALKRALREEMRRDPTVVIWGEDVVAYAGGGAYGVTSGLAKEFPGRVRDTPIAEEAIIGVGIGAAMGGMRPVCEIMTVNFTLVAWDQIVNHAAKQSHMFNGQIKVPMVIRTPNGHGRTASTHSQNFDTLFAHVPGLRVAAVATILGTGWVGRGLVPSGESGGAGATADPGPRDRGAGGRTRLRGGSGGGTAVQFGPSAPRPLGPTVT